MIVFTPDGMRKIVNDTMASTPGIDIVYDRGAYVLDVDVNNGVHVNEATQNLRATLESVFQRYPKSIENEP